MLTAVALKSRSPIRRSIVHSAGVFLGFSLLFMAFFAPTIFAGKLLAPGDGLIYYVPAFYAPRTLWTDLIFGGYPLMADSQNMNWYPPAMLLSLIPGSWNAFVLLAYILAGCFAYCYTYMMTASTLAAIVTGIIYSMSGFMMSHLGHTTMIHAAAWMPLFVCALEQLRHRVSRWWLAIGALALACCFLGGHPQIFVYTMGLGAFYALFLGGQATVGRWRYYGWVLLLMAGGVALCAIQIIPTLELSRLSLRSAMTFGDFISFSFPKRQTLQLLFPYFFGSGYTPPYGLYVKPYWGGKWFLTEITGYVSWLAVPLVMLGTIAHRDRAVTRFWFWFGLVTLILAFGGDIFLGRMMYHVPLYNKFRAPARHFVEYSLAVSILAGLGIAAIQRRWATRRGIVQAMAASGALMLLSLISMALMYPELQARAAAAGVTPLQLWPWQNPAVGIPCGLFGLGLMALSFWSRWRHQRWTRLLLIAVLILDLASFGWFWEWKSNSPMAQRLQPVPIAQQYQKLLQTSHQRLLSDAEGAFTNTRSLFPNLTRLWDVPNLSGYSPLILSRVSELLQISSSGSLVRLPLTGADRGLDLMAVKYLLLPPPTEAPTVAPPGDGSPAIGWGETDLGIALGAGACAAAPMPQAVQLDLSDQPPVTTEIGLVSSLGCAVTIPDQTAVAQIEITDDQGQVETLPLIVGRDTAETAYDCAAVRSKMQHQRATIWRNLPSSDSCDVHQYVSRLPLHQPRRIRRLALKWTAPSGVLQLMRLRLVDRQPQPGTPIAGDRAKIIGPLEFSTQWQKTATQWPGATHYENQQVMPRTWLVPEAIALPAAQVLATIRTSRLPDGRLYQPETMALVEDPRAVFQTAAKPPTAARRSGDADRANILKLAATQVQIQTQSSTAAFLVLGDVFYPGWQATIDGQPTPIYQTNYIQRGVQVPAGEHLVEYRFEPMSFKLGAGITLGAFCGGAYGLSRVGRSPTASRLKRDHAT
jgi:hypothetical protein